MSRGRFICVSRLILKFNVKNSGDIVQASSFFDQKHVQSKKTIRMYSSSSFFDQQLVQSKKLIRMYSSSSFFVQARLRTRSSSFLVQVAPQRVPGHPEAKSGQNLIRNGLLEAILEASWPASKPASQAQPLARVFSTKRRVPVQARVFSTKCTRRRDRRVFSMALLPWATCNKSWVVQRPNPTLCH